MAFLNHKQTFTSDKMSSLKKLLDPNGQEINSKYVSKGNFRKPTLEEEKSLLFSSTPSSLLVVGAINI